MTPGLLDHLFVILVPGFAFPVIGWWAYQRFLERLAHEGGVALVREYQHTLIWLGGLGLSRYEKIFRDNDIDTHLLHSLTADDLRDLGVGMPRVRSLHTRSRMESRRSRRTSREDGGRSDKRSFS